MLSVGVSLLGGGVGGLVGCWFGADARRDGLRSKGSVAAGVSSLGLRGRRLDAVDGEKTAAPKCGSKGEGKTVDAGRKPSGCVGAYHSLCPCPRSVLRPGARAKQTHAAAMDGRRVEFGGGGMDACRRRRGVRGAEP